MKLTVEATRKNCRALWAFELHKGGAAKRGIPFFMTFAEWQWVWLSSGKWEERGNKGHQYVMARRGPDIGPYAVWNVDIKTQVENRREAVTNWSVASRQRQSERLKGVPKSAQTRQRMGEASRRRGAKPPVRCKPVEVNGVPYGSLGAAAAAHGVSGATMRRRVLLGWLGSRWL